MESIKQTTNLLVQITNQDDFNADSNRFSPKPIKYVITENFSNYFTEINTATFRISVKSAVLNELNGKFHFKNGLSATDLQRVIKTYD